jgi:hypothetical protein
MKILVITSPHEDYLADSLFLGLRELAGTNCVDWPKAEVLYRDHGIDSRNRIYGRGFTLYTGILEDLPVDRFRVEVGVQEKKFDLIVFSSIHRQFGVFLQLRPWLDGKNTILIDGADNPTPYPAHGFFWRRPYYWCLPRAHRAFLYFKREWTEDTSFSIASRLIPRGARKWLPAALNLRQISFSFPSEKIVKGFPVKKKDFPRHIVDPEVAERVPGSATSYAFSSEAQYYEDLQDSRFGITTKRSGWDCLRHYEIAANSAVPCFRDLDKKPANCAPHGLNETNSICYHSAHELLDRIKGLTDEEYTRLQQGALRWVRAQTTELRAKEILEEFRRFREEPRG